MGVDIQSKIPADAVVDGAGGAPPAPPETPPAVGSDAAVSAGAQGAGAAAGAGGSAPGGGDSGPKPGETVAQWNLREALKGSGVQVESFQDDKSAWEYVQAQIRQREQVYAQEMAHMRQLAEWGQYYQANRAKFEAALQQPAAPAAAAGAQAQNPWNPPAFNEADLAGIIRNPDGTLAVAPGYAPDLVQKYQQYQRWQADRLSAFLRDPQSTLTPVLEPTINQIVEKAIADRLKGYDEQQFAQSYVQQQGQWMFEKDAFGRPLMDQFGRPVMSQAGQRFWHYTQEAMQRGITDARAQQQYAQNMTELEALRVAYQQGRAPAAPGAPAAQPVPGAPALPGGAPTNDQLKAAAVAAGARKLPGGGGAGAPPSADPAAPKPRAGFGARLTQALKTGGVSNVN